MLALESYGQACGFSVLTADELFYINGGSVGFSSQSSGSQSSGSSIGQKIGSWMQNTGEGMTTVGTAMQGWAAATGNSYDDAAVAIWNGTAAGLTVTGQAVKNASSGGSGGSGGGGK